MLYKPLHAITEHDLTAFLTQKEPESPHLEYKRDLNLVKPSEKKEFLRDICAFANSGGGLILFGVEAERDDEGAKTGRPGDVVGVDQVDVDSVQNIIRDGLSPPLRDCQIRTVGSFQRGAVVIVRVPQSWNSPHMIVYRTRSPLHAT